MVELWLNKAKEAEVVMDHISVVEPFGGTCYKKILFMNLNPERIKNIEAIAKYLMNLDATDSEWDEDLKNYDDLENEDHENYTSSTSHEDWRLCYVLHDLFFVVVVIYVDKLLWIIM